MAAIESHCGPEHPEEKEEQTTSFQGAKELFLTSFPNTILTHYHCFFSFKEIFNPVLYLCIIIVLKLAIPTPNYPAIETPQGTSSVTNPSPMSGVFNGPTAIGIAPNDVETRDFMENHVLKSPQLQVPPT